jgi:hypothetical protein
MIRQTYEHPEIDQGIMMFYKGIVGIDPTDCQRFTPLSDYEIRLSRWKKTPLGKFARKNTRIVTMDQLSTKDINDQALEASGMKGNPLLELLFIQMNKTWGLIEYQKEKVGLTMSYAVHNGYPRLVSLDEILADPKGAAEGVYEKMEKASSPAEFMAPPELSLGTYLYLHADFLKDHPVTRK